jgi:N,N'-diacetylchitobiose phosphorylase
MSPDPSSLAAPISGHAEAEGARGAPVAAPAPPLVIEPYGWFDHDAKEFALLRVDTPKPWRHLMSNGRVHAEVSALGGGVAWRSKRGASRRIVAGSNADHVGQPGWFLHLRDRATGHCWSPTPRPATGQLDSFECRFGLGYATYSATSGGIATRLETFVPPRQEGQAWSLTVHNGQPAAATWDVWLCAMIEDEELAATEVRYVAEGGGFLVATPRASGSAAESGADGPPSLYLASSLAPSGFDANPEHYIGRWRTPATPQGVEAGQSFNCEVARGPACMALRVAFALNPGASGRIDFFLGCVDSGADPRAAATSATTALRGGACESWREQLNRAATDQRAVCQAEIPDAAVADAFNVWSAWQAAVSACANATLPPDEAPQASRGLVPLEADPRERAALEPIELGILAAAENPELLAGAVDALHGFAVERGDEGLALVTRHLDIVMERVREAGELTEETGLLLTPDGSACLVTRSAQLAWALEMAFDLCDASDRHADAAVCASIRERLLAAVNERGWNGAFYFDAVPLDEKVAARTEAAKDPTRFLLDPQSWAVLSGAANAEKERGKAIMNAVFARLDTPLGPKTRQAPAPRATAGDPASLDPPGHGANGGIATRSAAWAIMADAKAGGGARPFQTYRKIIPSLQCQASPEAYALEPWRCGWEVAGPESMLPGRASGRWANSAAGWARRAFAEHVLGVRPEWRGLRFDPCVPPEWRGFVVRRRFRGAVYQVFVENPNGETRGLRSMELDGHRVGGSVIPAQDDTAAHVARVSM